MLNPVLDMAIAGFETAQRRAQQQEAAKAKAQQAAQQAQQAQQGGGGEGGKTGGGAEGGGASACGQASPQAQAGARQCAAAGDGQKAQAVGEGGCQGSQGVQTQQAPRPARGVGEDAPRNPPANGEPVKPPVDVKKPVPNPDPDKQPPRQNPDPDAQAAARNAPTKVPRNISHHRRDALIAENAKKAADAEAAKTAKPANFGDRFDAVGKKGDEVKGAKPAGYQDVDGADAAIAGEIARKVGAARKAESEMAAANTSVHAKDAPKPGSDAEKKAQADAVQKQMNANHPERVPPAEKPAVKNEKLEKTLAKNPKIKTNQDLINHFFKEGGGDWGGAVKKAQEAGVKMTQLIANRRTEVPRAA